MISAVRKQNARLPRKQSIHNISAYKTERRDAIHVTIVVLIKVINSYIYE